MTSAPSRSLPPPAARLGHRDVLRIALPITLSNATVPMIGFVDTATIGQLGDAALMGAVAVGAVIFNMLYWTFSFLRMGTTGLTAQALGAGDTREIAGHLLRALLVAILAGLTLIAAQVPLRALSFWLTGGSPEVIAAAHTYFDIRIWAAPAGLVNFAILGWLIGLGRAGVAFALQLFLNLTNMGLAIAFTLGLGQGIAGVGWAALIAEVLAAAAGLAAAVHIARRTGAHAPWRAAIDTVRLRHALAINTDISLRTVATFAAMLMFTAEGARAGDVTLAANALLVNMMNIVIYLIDGFAFAVESLVGRTVGAGDRSGFWRAVRLCALWAASFALLVGAGLWLAGPGIIAASARSEAVRTAALAFLGWAALAPIAGVWCFQLDGIFIGATRTRDMRNMMLLSLAAFCAFYWLLAPRFGNHGLWGAYMLFYLVRAATLASRLPALDRDIFGRTGMPRAPVPVTGT